jgi:predicted metalloprotease with PDZ domain
MPSPTPIRYRVDLGRRHQHLVGVELEVPLDLTAGGRVVLPVWTPGSYVVRDYVHHLQSIEARSSGGDDVPLTADGVTAWRLPAHLNDHVTVRLELYANELTVRTNHVDDHHALLVPPATFPYVEGGRGRPHEVTLELPANWRVWGMLPEEDGVHRADDYDHLVDGAFEAGDHIEVAFDVRDVPHRLVWAGHAGRPDLRRTAQEIAAVAEQSVELFGGELPTTGYTFIVTAWDRGGGGLEHRDGAVVQVPVHDLTHPEGIDRFRTLLTHEYVHLWNVKRLVPAALTELDYERPVPTPSLWVAEGWTAYYDDLLPLRAGVRPVRRFLDALGASLRGVLDRPGRQIQSVRQASHESWTKFYVRDENTPNVGVSYYDHGAVLAWCLDLLIRQQRPSGDGLDDALRLLWERFSGALGGYTEEDVEQAVADAAGTDLGWFFTRHVGGVDDPPVMDLLDVVGLERREESEGDSAPAPDLGVVLNEEGETVTIASVLRGRAAWTAGLTGGDRVVAVDRVRIGPGDLVKALRAYEAGERIEVAVLRGPRLLLVPVTLGEPRRAWKLRPVDGPTRQQRAAFRRWTGHQLPTDGTGD